MNIITTPINAKNTSIAVIPDVSCAVKAAKSNKIEHFQKKYPHACVHIIKNDQHYLPLTNTNTVSATFL